MNENGINLSNQNGQKMPPNTAVRGADGAGEIDGNGVAVGDFGSRQRAGDP